MSQALEKWLWKYLAWFDQVVGAIGFDLVFVLSLVAVALGVQLNCHGSKCARILHTSAGLVLTGTVALGHGSALIAMNLVGKATGRVEFNVWWWITAFLATVAMAAFAAQTVQHVQLLRRMKEGETSS